MDNEDDTDGSESEVTDEDSVSDVSLSGLDTDAADYLTTIRHRQQLELDIAAAKSEREILEKINDAREAESKQEVRELLSSLMDALEEFAGKEIAAAERGGSEVLMDGEKTVGIEEEMKASVGTQMIVPLADTTVEESGMSFLS